MRMLPTSITPMHLSKEGGTMNPYNKPSPQAYLVHHGIKGQKWGVRRFQNEDGSLTAAGRKRYDVDIIPTIFTTDS
jgi:hypothetical protein